MKSVYYRSQHLMVEIQRRNRYADLVYGVRIKVLERYADFFISTYLCFAGLSVFQYGDLRCREIQVYGCICRMMDHNIGKA